MRGPTVWLGQRVFPAKPVAMLDVGSHKIVCLIGMRADGAAGRGRLLGYAYRRSEGVVGGRISNMAAAEMCVRQAIAQAEKMADATVDVAFAAMSTPARAERFQARAALPFGAASGDDIDRILLAVRRDAARRGEAALHLHPRGFAVDDDEATPDPRGLPGGVLSADLSALFAEAQTVRRVQACLARMHIALGGFAVSSFASALGVLSDAEAERGALVIDMGAASTAACHVAGGALAGAASVREGGAAVTADLAQAFALSMAEAERLKTMHGGVLSGPEDEGESIRLAIDAHGGQVLVSLPKPEVNAVVRKRQEAIFRALAAEIGTAAAGRPVILTGGGSQLLGAAALAERVFGGPARAVAPAPLFNGPSPEAGPGFAAAAGLFSHAGRADFAANVSVLAPEEPARGYFARVGEWLRQGF
ncbi:MAG: cell division protein FtsA [Hyphomicrobiales bacterium]|nr:cell division protein FtsA [Hyphomicrobiales bacterium]